MMSAPEAQASCLYCEMSPAPTAHSRSDLRAAVQATVAHYEQPPCPPG
jgi:hypothetical protein